MERLTCKELKPICDGYFINFASREEATKYRMLAEKAPKYEEIYKRLAKYEDAEEQGLLLRLPCKVGDVVYFPKYDYHDSAIIEQIRIDQQSIDFDWVQYEVGVDITECWDDGYFSIDEIGKTVFLTREEAEQALKQMGE